MNSGKFIKDAVAIVTQAIEEDNAQNYPKAFDLYHKALETFMIGLKYEKKQNHQGDRHEEHLRLHEPR